MLNSSHMARINMSTGKTFRVIPKGSESIFVEAFLRINAFRYDRRASYPKAILSFIPNVAPNTLINGGLTLTQALASKAWEDPDWSKEVCYNYLSLYTLESSSRKNVILTSDMGVPCTVNLTPRYIEIVQSFDLDAFVELINSSLKLTL